MLMKIDLITGFLGSGKTTFIRAYAKHCVNAGENVCILENDHGAINVDALALHDLEGEHLDVEMIVGGDGAEAHKRRFHTKLISFSMLGYDRIIVEPSGIYDVDEFFDTLQEDPLPRCYEIGSVIALVDARTPLSLYTETSAYLLASQVACAGVILITHLDETERTLAQVKEELKQLLDSIKCDRVLSGEIIAADLSDPTKSLSKSLFLQIKTAGYVPAVYEKYDFDSDNEYQTLFYMHHHQTRASIRDKMNALFADASCGDIRRIKGFLLEGATWYQINATKGACEITPVASGQDVLLVIGEMLDKSVVDTYFN